MSGSLLLDHLTILSRDEAASARFYGLLLPLIGFRMKRPGIWSNDRGLFLQFLGAKPDTADYQRHAPGLNHLGFQAPDRERIEAIKAALDEAGFESRLQTFGEGVVALFIPDPDGLRVEVSYYPPGVDPVG